ncbi:hypothetical protein JL722_7028 [Aureococcus anophagefferens]|nr:hypothetical protein JL722_7028 [Aureococcus anophagefferens]
MAEDDSSVALVALALQIEEPQLTEKMADYLSSAEGLAALCAFITLDGATIELPSSEPDAPADDASDGDAAPPDLALVRSFRGAAWRAAATREPAARVERHAALVARALFGVFAADARAARATPSTCWTASSASTPASDAARAAEDGEPTTPLPEARHAAPRRASAATARRRGSSGEVLGVVVDDDAGEVLLQALAHCGVEAKLAAVVADRSATYGGGWTARRRSWRARWRDRAAEASGELVSSAPLAGATATAWATRRGPSRAATRPTATTTRRSVARRRGDDDAELLEASGVELALDEPTSPPPPSAEQRRASRSAPTRAFRGSWRRRVGRRVAAALDVNEAHAIELAVKHPGRQAGLPFTLLRLRLLEMRGRASGKRRAGRRAPERFWAALCGWFFDAFPENAQFHRLFFALVSTALRCRGAAKRTAAPRELRPAGRLAAALERRGPPHVLGLCDVLRLHAATLPPAAYARAFLGSHGAWSASEAARLDFAREANATRPRGPPDIDADAALLADLNLTLENPLVVDEPRPTRGQASTSRGPGSPYALLGFEDEAPWSS